MALLRSFAPFAPRIERKRSRDLAGRGYPAAMAKKLFLLDGMALVYRAHFAFISRPILTSKGVNTSALYGFTQPLLEILNKHQPTHIAVAFDTAVPTHRHLQYPGYKPTPDTMPED